MAAGLRFAVLFAATNAVLLAAASASPSPRPPAVYVVGDQMGWAGSTAGALNDWAARHRFLVGDVLDFKHSNGDSVLLVRPGDYERCSAASPVNRFADGGGGGTRFTLGRPGLFYFISGAPSRCEAGQRMAVRVVDGDARRRSLITSAAPTPAPAPAPAPAPGSQTSDTPHRRPLSLAHKQFAAAAIGFGAGVILFGASSAAASSAPAVYDVGGARGWAVPPANSTDTINKWAMRHRFHVGDILHFKYSSNDSVLLVRPRDYDGCSAASPVSRLKGSRREGVKFRLGHPGIFFFISGVPAHCEAGLRLVVLVADKRGWFGGFVPMPAPAPAPGGMEDDEPSHAPSGDRPIPVAFRLFVAAGLGFVSGCFLAGVVLWLCVNCGR